MYPAEKACTIEKTCIALGVDFKTVKAGKEQVCNRDNQVDRFSILHPIK